MVYNGKIGCLLGLKKGWGNVWGMGDDELCEVKSEKRMREVVGG